MPLEAGGRVIRNYGKALKAMERIDRHRQVYGFNGIAGQAVEGRGTAGSVIEKSKNLFERK